MHSGTKGGSAWSGGLGIRSVKVGGYVFLRVWTRPP